MRKKTKHIVSTALILSMIMETFAVTPLKAEAKTPELIGNVTSIIKNDEISMDASEDTYLVFDYENSGLTNDNIKEVTCSYTLDGKKNEDVLNYQSTGKFNGMTVNCWSDELKKNLAMKLADGEFYSDGYFLYDEDTCTLEKKPINANTFYTTYYTNTLNKDDVKENMYYQSFFIQKTEKGYQNFSADPFYVADKNGPTYYDKIGKEKVTELKKLISEINDFTLHVKYDNGTSIDRNIDIVYSSETQEYNKVSFEWQNKIRPTIDAIVVKVADSQTITNKDFYQLENAIFYETDGKDEQKKFYADIDSEDDIVLPLNQLSSNAKPVKFKIGNDVVYQNENAVKLTDVSSDTYSDNVYQLNIRTQFKNSQNETIYTKSLCSKDNYSMILEKWTSGNAPYFYINGEKIDIKNIKSFEDITNIIENGTCEEKYSGLEYTVKDYYKIKEMNSYDDTICQTKDDKTTLVTMKLARPVSVVTNNEETTVNGGSITFQSENNSEIRVPVKSLVNEEKGTTYDITSQIISDGFLESGDLDYMNGSLLRNNSETILVNNCYVTETFTDYKYGELILASKPSPSRNLTYEDNIFTWTRPQDEGLGEDGKTDDVVYVTQYTINVYDEKDNLIYTTKVKDNKQETLSIQIPENVKGIHKFEVLADNIIGTSVAISEIHPSMTVTKTADKDVYEHGKQEKARYTITVTNTGDCNLHNVKVTESLVGTFQEDTNISIDKNVASISRLKTGESYVFYYIVDIDTITSEEILTNHVDVSSDECNANTDKDINITYPTITPTVEPTQEPTMIPTEVPTAVPTAVPTTEPTVVPTTEPTNVPTIVPTVVPTVEPTNIPTIVPTIEPTVEPTVIPTVKPTIKPTEAPTHPSMEVTKTADKKSCTYGKDEKITYTIKVKNTGDCDLHNIVVTEEMTGAFKKDANVTIKKNTATIDILKPGKTYTLYYIVDVDKVAKSKKALKNHVTAVADECEAEATSILDILYPSINPKTGDETSIKGWIMMLIAGAFGMGAAVIVSKKKKKK